MFQMDILTHVSNRDTHACFKWRYSRMFQMEKLMHVSNGDTRAYFKWRYSRMFPTEAQLAATQQYLSKFKPLRYLIVKRVDELYYELISL